MHTPQNGFAADSLNENSIEWFYALVSGILCFLPLPEVHSFILFKKDLSGKTKQNNELDWYVQLQLQSTENQLRRFESICLFYFILVLSLVLYYTLYNL